MFASVGELDQALRKSGYIADPVTVTTVFLAARLHRPVLLEGPAGKKVLLLLDQFEQWLHAHGNRHGTELVQALRQCDGGRLQCILMVRDDFWMAVTRFLAELEVDLVQGPDRLAARRLRRRRAVGRA